MSEFPSFSIEGTSNKVPVYLRLKPKGAGVTSDRILTVSPPGSSRIVLENNKECSFDGIFGETTTQIDLYKNVVFPLVENTINGSDSLFFTMGATGSGKVRCCKHNSLSFTNSHY